MDFYSYCSIVIVRSTVLSLKEIPIGDGRMRKILGQWCHADAMLMPWQAALKKAQESRDIAALKFALQQVGVLRWMLLNMIEVDVAM